jgi:hypothetical protein
MRSNTRRRFRRSVFGTATNSVSPLFRMIAFLIVLALVYSWTSKPRSWSWLEDRSATGGDDPGGNDPGGDDNPAIATGGKTDPDQKPATPEVIVPGPTDENAAEAAAAHPLFEAVTDRQPLEEIEMPAYWRSLKWARAQSFADLERRAEKHVVFTQLWQQPDKYRGKLIRLRLHVALIVTWDAGENSAGVKHVYEVWGWTDQSKSFPYLVILDELPKGIPIGDGLHEEGVFVGYFLKWMSYTAANSKRSSPLLLGRMKWMPATAPVHPVITRSDWRWLGLVGIPIVLLIGAITWFRMRRVSPAKLPAAAPADDAEMENWFQSGAPGSTSAGPSADGAAQNRPPS